MPFTLKCVDKMFRSRRKTHRRSPHSLLQEIHKKVMALSFRDCHTKIRHVDAHATLTEGVVVQVMGELSNNMQPMRKFMQTFVLAPEVG